MCSVIGQGRAGQGTVGILGRVEYDMVCFVSTKQRPTQSKPHIVQPDPTFGTPLGNVVVGREVRGEVMGRVGSLGRASNQLTVHCVHFPILTGSIISTFGTC